MSKTNTIHKHHVHILSILLAAVVIMIATPSTGRAQAAPPDAAPGSTLDQRIVQRKQERPIVLVEKDQKRLVSTCTNAQAAIRSVQQKNTAVLTKRTQLYTQIDGRVLVMVGKLKLAQKDTFEFEKQRTELVRQTALFNATGAGYKQALDDLTLINCKADPAGFKSMLETARAYKTSLRTQSTAIKAYVTDTVKPSLSVFASELQGKQE